MGTHSVAEAKNKLSELIDRALNGEEVVITRHGHPVVEMRATRPKKRPITQADLDWLKANRPPGQLSPTMDAGQLISTMRDEEQR
jgi:antitoxin (DNA-binding transcriptional repressor) of toxin-antitoxin stability system